MSTEAEAVDDMLPITREITREILNKVKQIVPPMLPKFHKGR